MRLSGRPAGHGAIEVLQDLPGRQGLTGDALFLDGNHLEAEVGVTGPALGAEHRRVGMVQIHRPGVVAHLEVPIRSQAPIQDGRAQTAPVLGRHRQRAFQVHLLDAHGLIHQGRAGAGGAQVDHHPSGEGAGLTDLDREVAMARPRLVGVEDQGEDVLATRG